MKVTPNYYIIILIQNNTVTIQYKKIVDSIIKLNVF